MIKYVKSLRLSKQFADLNFLIIQHNNCFIFELIAWQSDDYTRRDRMREVFPLTRYLAGGRGGKGSHVPYDGEEM